MNPIEYPFSAWSIFFVVVLTALFVDIGIVNRRSHAPTRKETIAWSAVWVSLALAFGVYVYWQFGSLRAKEFLTGYLIELSLSIDNLFVFLLIFNYFAVPKKYQHRVLFWGIFMALVLRMIMIFGGAELVEQFHWTLYLAGAFLLYTGVRMFGEEETFHPEESLIVSLTTRFIRISRHYDGERFFTRDGGGRRTGTLLLLVLVVINIADLVFAVDSIPAIFGITTDRFVVYTSNIFAILGLRTFFFLLLEIAEKFHFLKYGLAFVLSFIGVKMLLPLLLSGLIILNGDESVPSVTGFLRRVLSPESEYLFINFSLVVVLGAILVSIALSLLFPHHPESSGHRDASS
jgi:tellurite resistance protein TerC